MKINSVTPSGMVERYRDTSVKLPEETRVGETSDRVEFSGEAKSFASVFNRVKDDLDVRSQADKDRFAQIASQIEAGTYEVSSDDVAAKILGGSIDIEI